MDILQDKIFYRPHIQIDCKMTKMLVQEKRFSDSPLTIGDVGVRYGFDRMWDIFEDQCLLVGFEPDAEECDRIGSEYFHRVNQHLPEERIENTALWDMSGNRKLYITKEISASSCYPPATFHYRLPNPSEMEVIKIIDIQTTTLDKYCIKTGTNFDVLKLDIQGGELNVLRGGERQLEKDILAVITEVEFVELYQKQPFFEDVNRFMRTKGFSLFDLDIRRWNRKILPKTFDDIKLGQIVYADALYLKDPIQYNIKSDNSQELRSKLLKLSSLAECFSLPDYSIEILNYSRERGALDGKEEKFFSNLILSNKIEGIRDRNFPKSFIPKLSDSLT